MKDVKWWERAETQRCSATLCDAEQSCLPLLLEPLWLARLSAPCIWTKVSAGTGPNTPSFLNYFLMHLYCTHVWIIAIKRCRNINVKQGDVVFSNLAVTDTNYVRLCRASYSSEVNYSRGRPKMSTKVNSCEMWMTHSFKSQLWSNNSPGQCLTDTATCWILRVIIFFTICSVYMGYILD